MMGEGREEGPGSDGGGKGVRLQESSGGAAQPLMDETWQVKKTDK